MSDDNQPPSEPGAGSDAELDAAEEERLASKPTPPPTTAGQRFWSRLAVDLGKHAGLVALVGLLITLVAGVGITQLEFATGQDSYLNKDNEVYENNIAYQELFGGQAMLVMLRAEDGRSIADVMTKANLEELQRAGDGLREQEDLVLSVVTPVEALQWSENLLTLTPEGEPAASPTESAAGIATLNALEDEPDPEAAALRQEDAIVTLERVESVPEEQRSLFAEDNLAWVDVLLYDNAGEVRTAQEAVFRDDTHAQVVVRLVGNADIETEGDGAIAVREAFESAQLEGIEVVVTGAPVLLKDINDYLTGGMLQLGGIALVIMAIILLLLFNVRWRLLPLAVILVGVVWAFGLAGYLGIPLSLVTIAGLPILLGIGIDYAIQMHARVEEEVIIDRADHPIQEASRNLGPALLVVTVDVVLAMAALRFAQVPMIRAFGLLLAVGIAVVCLASIFLPLSALGAREYRSPTTGKDWRDGAMAKGVATLGSLPKWLAPVFAVASVFVFAGGLAVEDRLDLQTDVLEWVDQDSQNLKDFRTVEEETGSSSELGFFITSDEYDIFSQEVTDYTWDYSQQLLGQHPEALLNANSLVTTIGYAAEVPGTTPLPPRAADVQAGYELAPRDIQLSTIAEPSDDDPNGAANLLFLYGPSSLDERREVLAEIDATTPVVEGITVVPSGLAVVGSELVDAIKANRILLTYLAIAFVGVFLALQLRSLVRSLLALVPVVIAVGGTSLVAFGLGLKLSPMTAVSGPLVIAACTEFTALMILRYLEERRRGLWPAQASHVASARTGRAFVVSALTTMTGVAVIATSSLPLLRDFGIVVAVNVTVALLAALVVLPPLLVWADERGWVSKGRVPDDVLRATTPRYAGMSEAEALDGAPDPVAG